MNTTSTTITTTRHVFTQEDILSALRLAGKIPCVPINQCFVRVPGGGDWSNVNLGLDEHPVVVVIKEVKES